MSKYLIALGTSQQNGPCYIERALIALNKKSHISLVSQSRIYQNGSQGMHVNYLFHNCVCAVETSRHPHTFYRELSTIEYRLGRIRTYRNAPRTIDIDVLLSLDLIYISSNFFVPHKQVWERNFFVIPAIEALKLAGWPLPAKVLRAGLKFGRSYLCPLSCSD